MMLSEIPDEIIPILAIGGGLIIAVVAIVLGNLSTILRTRAREQTKREVAAYLAEGSITSEDAERIISADLPIWERGGKRSS